jgi:hypothetical protein
VITRVAATAFNANRAAGDPAPTDLPRAITQGMPPGLSAPQDAPQAAPPAGDRVIETPPPATAEILRNTEPVPPSMQTLSAPPPASSPAQEFAVRIAQPNTPVVDLHVAERNGQVQVAVRTPDTGLQTSLRQDLGTLVNSLERAGYHAEMFTPSAGLRQASAAPDANSEDSRAGSHGSSGEWTGGGTGGGHPQPRQRGQNSQTWRKEWENQS